MKTEQETYAKMKIQEPDNNKKIYEHFYYHVLAHGIGNTYIAIADFMNIPSIDPTKRSLGENGIIYQDSVDAQKSYIRLYDPNNRQGSLPKGWRLTKLLRDDDHIYFDGVEYEIEKRGDNEEITIINMQLEPHKDFYHEIEAICTQINNIQKGLASSLFYNSEDKKNIRDFVGKINKEIANIRIDVSKTYSDER